MASESARDEARARLLATVADLVAVADGDTLYRDVYLRRAAELLTPVVSEAGYESALERRDQLARLLAQARAAVGREDWAKVRDLGTRAADLQRSLDAGKDVLAAAASVYGAPAVALDPLSPGLARFTKRWSSAAQAHAELTALLNGLAAEDTTTRDLYRARERAVAGIAVPQGAASAGAATPRGSNASQSALQAIERGDATALQALAESMTGGRATAAADGGGAGVRAAILVPEALGEPLPDGCRARAAALGLEPVDVAIAAAAVAAAISEFVGEYALSASAATFDRARDGVARLTLAAGEVHVPPAVAALFAESVSLFALHLYVNSAGVRYVPIPAAREALLLETHAEGEESRTSLLRELGLAQRRGLARNAIESALAKQGPRVLAELLGLDPLAFRLVCIPPDVYMRVGRERGWGAREEWTHLDGYQVMAGGRLRALVGGNARFGGLFDLCSLSADDGRENTLVRFAVVRRERLGARIG
jgi:hypothetical protein